jgi:DNA excision repair protein ERCC-4
MMEKKLRVYLGWKGKLGIGTRVGGLSDGVGDGHQSQKKTGIGGGGGGDGDGDGVSEALKRKDQVMRERGASRRRVRGGAPPSGGIGNGGGGGGGKKGQKDTIVGENEMRDEAERVANL